jgi:hypothetical protein
VNIYSLAGFEERERRLPLERRRRMRQARGRNVGVEKRRKMFNKGEEGGQESA